MPSAYKPHLRRRSVTAIFFVRGSLESYLVAGLIDAGGGPLPKHIFQWPQVGCAHHHFLCPFWRGLVGWGMEYRLCVKNRNTFSSEWNPLTGNQEGRDSYAVRGNVDFAPVGKVNKWTKFSNCQVNRETTGYIIWYIQLARIRLR